MESKYSVFDKYIGQGRKLPIYEVKNKATLDSCRLFNRHSQVFARGQKWMGRGIKNGE